MKKFFLVALSFAFLSVCAIPAKAMEDKEAGVDDAQTEYEREINAIVRNKHFYKSGKIEVTASAGVMPYDSLVSHFLVGGRAAWHLHDHFAWEIADFHVGVPSVTSFVTGLVRDKGVSNLQTLKLKMLASSNFLLSPVYGKVRFFGRQILYFDVYLVLGGGMANTETLQLSSPGSGQAGTETVLKTGWDPMVDFGFGIKLFATDTFGLVIDMRDYIVSSQLYGNKTLKSNFSVSLGATLFLPGF